MLRLMDVQKLSDDTYSLVLDRDGKRLQYELRWRPPSHEGGLSTLDHSDQIVWDLMDYEVIPPPGRPHGAIWIPLLRDIGRAVSRVIRGEEVDFPIVLDER